MQLGPVRRGQVLGDGLEVGHRVDAEEERHALGIPGVELLGLGEVGVAAEVDPAEAGLAAQQDRQVELLGGPLVRGAVAGAVDDAEHLAGIGQRDDQRVIAPGAVVGDVDALLAAGAGGDERAVDVEDGLVEEAGGLLLPELDPRLIEDVLEGLDVLGREATAEVAGGGGVGDAVGAEGVEEDDIIASQFDVVEAGAVAEGVVGEVQDVVGLVIGEVELEQVEPLVDGLGEPEFADQELDGADAAAGDGAGLGGDLVVDVRGGEDRLGRGCGDRAVEPSADFPLAGGVVPVWNRSSLEISLGLGPRDLCALIQCAANPGRFRVFPHQSRDSSLGPRLVKANMLIQ